MSLGERLQHDWWQARLTPLTAALLPLEGLYRLLFAAHSAAFKLGLRRARRLPVPVLVVGNCIVGGAGKTPTVLALVQALQQAGWRPGVVSRGYGRSTAQLLRVDAATDAKLSGDEPLLIHLRSGAPVTVSADRVEAARDLLAAHPQVDLIVCDDGLQHHRLGRDLQLIVFDERGAGNGHCLPAGPLREPLPAVAPKDTWVLYNAPGPSTPLAGAIALRALLGLVPLAAWWRGETASPAAWAELRSRPVHAVAGLAHPAKFFTMLRTQGLTLTEIALPDHAAFDRLPWPDNAADIILTEKDAVKLRPDGIVARTRARVWVAPLDLQLPAALLQPLLARLQDFRPEPLHDR